MADKVDEGKGKDGKNVKSIESKRRQKMDKIPKGLLIEAVGRHFAGDYRFLIPPPVALHVFEGAENQDIILLEEERGTVRIVNKFKVQKEIAKWIVLAKKDDPELQNFTPTDVAQCVSAFLYHAKPLEALPNAFGFSDFAEPLTFQRLEFTPTEADLWVDRKPWQDDHLVDKFPILDLFRRCSQPEALAAWIGGLFYRGSYQQQYVYLHGPGGCGKSSLLKLLKHIIGSAYHADNLDDARGRFWTNAFLGKRLVAFPDTNYSKFTATGTIKAITGGDDVRIEIKGGAVFSTPLEARFLFVSNRAPELVDDEATRRRAIIIEAEGLSNSRTVQYEQRILEPAQVQFFVEMVMEYYRQLCPSHEAIPVDQSKLFDHAEDIDEDVADFWHTTTFTDPNGAVAFEDLRERLFCRGVKGHEVRRYARWATDNLPVDKVTAHVTRGKHRTFILGVSWENTWLEAEKRNHLAQSVCTKYLPIKSTSET